MNHSNQIHLIHSNFKTFVTHLRTSSRGINRILITDLTKTVKHFDLIFIVNLRIMFFTSIKLLVLDQLEEASPSAVSLK